MAKNVSRNPTPSSNSNPIPQNRISRGLLSWLDKRFNMSKIIGKELPAHQFYYAIWLAFLLLTYIYFSHRAEGLLRESERLRKEVGDLRADYITTKAAFMKESKQSEIAKKVASLGLKESKTPPIILNQK
jgi:cell division protein FtsL